MNLKVSTTISLGQLGQFEASYIAFRSNPVIPLLRHNLQDLQARVKVRKREIELSVEATGSAQGGVDSIRAVGCAW